MRTNRTVRATLVLLLVAGMSLGTMGGAGTAQTSPDSGPPRMDLRWPGHSTQAGVAGSSCWSEPGEPGLCIDTTGGFPKAMWVRSGETLKVRIHHPEKPSEFDISAWPRQSDGAPAGTRRRHVVQLRPVVRDGETRAWDAVFQVTGRRQHYLTVFGVWPQGDASWGFHVRTLG